MAAVDLIEVSKRLGSTVLLNQLSLSIKKGEFMVVVGPSGCGKSTLLRLIAGLDTPSSGSIRINNQCMDKVPAAKRDMAMVFQNYALYPHMTVFDNMAYSLKMRHCTQGEIKKKVMDVAQLLQLTPYLQRKPQALSGGQKQRVAMGRAMVRSPAVFLFDEPLSNLDAQLRSEMRYEIKKIHKRSQTTSLYVTHDQTEAMTMGERVLVLKQGVVEQIGTPQELYQNPATLFVAGFTGHYPINCFALSTLGSYYPAAKWIETIAENKEVILAIRPEHVLLCTQETKGSIALQVEFIEDMGADKLIQARCLTNEAPFCLRVSADCSLGEGKIHVELPAEKLHLFDQKTGNRLGEQRG